MLVSDDLNAVGFEKTFDDRSERRYPRLWSQDALEPNHDPARGMAVPPPSLERCAASTSAMVR